MGIFDKFFDSPDRIRTEGQEISLKFQRTSDTTGVLTWNIPPPSAGCNTDSQAYNGIVLTVSSQPANYNSTSPVDGKYYDGDPSVNPDLNTGSKLDGAMVVGAFYDDKTTTILNLTDLTPKTSYYFSGYAVDNVARYHREGVHSYSLPNGSGKPNNEMDLPAIQDVGIDSPQGITPTTFTGLDSSKNYALVVSVNDQKYTLNIPGTLALDYNDLVFQINQEFIRLTDNKYVGPYPPNTNQYHVDITNRKVYQWDGYQEVPVTGTTFYPQDPSVPLNGSMWYNPTTQQLFLYNAGWIPQSFISSSYDFANPQCYNFWFNGTNAYEWEKVLWCQLPTYVSETNPLLPPTLDCNSFWYNTSTGIVSQWDVQNRVWNSVNVLYSDADPNSISSGDYWYNQVDNNVYYYAANMWNQLNNVVFVDPDANGNFPNQPIANTYWFVPSTQTLYRRDAGNTAWVQLDIIVFVSDPTNRTSCQLWWDSVADTLNIWDVVNTRWTLVSNFFQQAIDPALPIEIPLNSAWYNPTMGMLTIINNPDCTQVQFVSNPTDPTVMTLNQIWYNPNTNVWSQWDGSGWLVVNPIVNTQDPYILSIGSLWFNTSANQLNKWSGAVFINTTYTTTPIAPEIGTLWFNSLTQILYGWDGVTWTETIGIAAAKLILQSNFRRNRCHSCVVFAGEFNDGIDLAWGRDVIRFYTKDVGCTEHLEICFDGVAQDGMVTAWNTQTNSINFVFAHISQQVRYFRAIKGYSALPSGPMYSQIGVGTDGSPDDRRKFHDIIRSALGDPPQKVELTKQQIDICIDNSLKMLRKNSNVAYKRAYFFLDAFPNQQMYELKDECVGFNKIVDINAIYRTRAGLFAANGLGGDGMFAWSALTQLYAMGTFDTLSFHLVQSYVKDLQMLFADNIMFQWVESNRQLRVYEVFMQKERILLDGTIERTEQDLLTNRETTLWLQKWSIAEAKLNLAQIRGKFAVLPGPNGNTTLNAQDLISQAEQEMTDLKEELHDFVMQDAMDAGIRSHFIIG